MSRSSFSARTGVFRAALVLCALAICGVPSADAAESPIVKLLKSGRVPAERLPVVVEMLCRQASAEDLRYVYDRLLSEEGLPAAARDKALAGLTEAAAVRGVVPAGDLSGIASLLTAAPSPVVQRAAIRLAAQWRVVEVVEPLLALALDGAVDAPLRAEAIAAVEQIAPERARDAALALAADGQPQSLRYQAIATLAAQDLPAAAALAPAALRSATERENLWPALEPFLTRQGGPEALAAALAADPPEAELAKRVLRAMYAGGQANADLSVVLSAAAGIENDPPPPTPDQVAELAAAAVAEGDPARGELIFRSRDLGCLKCHSLAGAGGQVGPELSALGGSSPVDYVVNSILNPSLAIKEQFVTRIVQTDEGQIFTGIVLQRDDAQLTLKDATGEIFTIPLASIEEEFEGKSLMPNGLTRFLSHGELLDLIRFISELGKPGPYAIRHLQLLQRYRLMTDDVSDLTGDAPNTEFVRERIVDATAGFAPLYANIAGELPLADCLDDPGQSAIVFLQGELDVRVAGSVGLRVAGPPGTLLWLDGAPCAILEDFQQSLEVGVHKLTFRVRADGAQAERLRVEAYRPEGSAAEFAFVGGQ